MAAFCVSCGNPLADGAKFLQQMRCDSTGCLLPLL